MVLNVALEMNGFQMTVAVVVFFVTIFFIITEKLPNSISAMLGAFVVVAFHVISQEEAIDAIDFDTIGLLCGMMLSVSVMRKSGLFEYVAIKGIKLAKGNPWRILVSLSIVTAVLSAFLDNVTTVLIIVPLTFAVADTIKIDPMPFLVSEVLFSNIGGTATLIGDPPNIMIGGATHLEFMDFVHVNAPIVLVISLVTLLLLRAIYHKKLASLTIDREKIHAFDETRAIHNRKLFFVSLSVFGLIILAFITHHVHGIRLASIALGGGFVMMLVTRQDPEQIAKEVEWSTLFFFIGLFIIIGGLEKTGIISFLADKLIAVTGGSVPLVTQLILWISAFSTTVVNSIPYTATLISVIENISATTSENIDPLWWALSLGACLGGNGTLIGSAANIIVASFSQKTSFPMSFKQYFKIGFPLMLVSVILASVYLWLRFFAWL